MSKVICGLLFNVFLSGCAVHKQTTVVKVANLNSQDVTQSEYWNVWYDNDKFFTDKEIRILRENYTILLVPGYFSDFFIGFGNAIKGVAKVGGYFDDQMSWMSGPKVKISFVRVPVKPAETIQYNSKIIAQAIEESKKPVILITHSKGSLDVLEALLHQEVNRKKVKGWISIQGAFFGSPVADIVLGNRTLTLAAIEVLRRMDNGNIDSLRNISTTEASRYQIDNQEEIAKLVKEVPTISFGSWVPQAKWTFGGMALSKSFENLNLESDRLLPKRSTVLPGTDWVMLIGVGHADPVMKNYFVEFDRVRFTKTLLSMLLRRMGVANDRHISYDF